MNSNAGYKIYNIGTGKNYSINNVAKMIKGSVGTTYLSPRPAEVKETLADISESISDLSWFPKHALEDKINEY